jgi:hypothetical protein
MAHYSHNMATRPHEQRKEPRTRCDKSGTYVRMAGETSFEEGATTVLDMSSSGMLLRMPKTYKAGSIIELRLPHTRHGELTAVLETCWSQSSPKRDPHIGYLVGCRTLFARLA